MTSFLLVLGATASADTIAPDKLEYQGAFQCNIHYAGHAGLAYYAAGQQGAGSMFMVSTGGGTRVREFALATPVKPPGALPMVNEIMNFTPNAGADGLEYLPIKGTQTSGKLYWGRDSSGAQQMQLGYGDVDGTNQVGYWNRAGSRVGKSLFGAPQDWADTNTSGRSLLALGHRYGRPGPRLRAVAPWTWTWVDSGSGYDNNSQASTLLLEYDSTHPLQIPGDGDGTSSDDYLYGAYITNTAADASVLIGGKSVNGGHVLLFYDPADLAAVAAGGNPYDPQPYDVIDMSAYLTQGTYFGGAAFDENKHILYVSEYGGGGSNYGTVHVFHIAEPTLPIPEPAGLGLMGLALLSLRRRRS